MGIKDTTYVRWSTPPILVKRPRTELWDIEEVRQTAVSGDRAHACKNPIGTCVKINKFKKYSLPNKTRT